MARILYLCPDAQIPHGGNYVIYRHVDILRAHGFDAWAVHQESGFRYSWFNNETAVTTLKVIAPIGADVLVLPENVGPAGLGIHRDCRRVIFNQNAYLTFHNSFGSGSVERFYREAAGVLCVSEDSAEYLRFAFPEVSVTRLHLSIDSKLFCPQEKARTIVYMPRKGGEDASQILLLLESRGLSGFSVKPLDGLPLSGVAEALGRAAIFLSFSQAEGFPLPPIEAMVSGCLVVGYHGQGGREYFQPDFCLPVEPGALRSYCETVERAIALWDSGEGTAMAGRARRFVLDTYAEAREAQDLLDFWRSFPSHVSMAQKPE
ncbi:MAG: glycosyltransferase family 4 protein [Deltaproteobacteria bacterium]|nr:glycosyltransferase family 4 protein [Deltaproteobacteria bacterium]MBI3294112.1 glycosyltransferase family 4 protein [Deltaproteobacteria bacterium]